MNDKGTIATRTEKARHASKRTKASAQTDLKEAVGNVQSQKSEQNWGAEIDSQKENIRGSKVKKKERSTNSKVDIGGMRGEGEGFGKGGGVGVSQRAQ